MIDPVAGIMLAGIIAGIAVILSIGRLRIRVVRRERTRREN
jgi:hypothetical protein